MKQQNLSRRNFGRVSIAAAMGTLAFASSAPAHAAPNVDLWQRWTAHNPNSPQSVNHSAWDAFTRKYVSRGPDGVALMNYSGVSAGDNAALNGYLGSLAATPVSSLNRNEQFAYWLNLYNALTVKVILDHFPVDSIRDIDISPGFFSNGPWGAKLITVEGEQVSLDDIEHRILRPVWRDPRIHYGVNCASIGCPDLMAGAFTAANLDPLLNQAAVNFINHPRGSQVRGNRVYVSSIYDWFQEDFGGNDAGVIAHLRQYAREPLASQLASVTRIGGDDYDWNLNNTTVSNSAVQGGLDSRNFDTSGSYETAQSYGTTTTTVDAYGNPVYGPATGSYGTTTQGTVQYGTTGNTGTYNSGTYNSGTYNSGTYNGGSTYSGSGTGSYGSGSYGNTYGNGSYGSGTFTGGSYRGS